MKVLISFILTVFMYMVIEKNQSSSQADIYIYITVHNQQWILKRVFVL